MLGRWPCHFDHSNSSSHVHVYARDTSLHENLCVHSFKTRHSARSQRLSCPKQQHIQLPDRDKREILARVREAALEIGASDAVPNAGTRVRLFRAALCERVGSHWCGLCVHV